MLMLSVSPITKQGYPYILLSVSWALKIGNCLNKLPVGVGETRTYSTGMSAPGFHNPHVRARFSCSGRG
jgi:hypothetical protein